MNAPGVTVWVGSSLVTPLSQSYLEKLNDEIVLAIESRMNLQEIFYMHDGAPDHYVQSVRHFLHETFPDRWIGRRGQIGWPVRSLDLTSTDFFLWEVIKDRVYTTKPQNLRALKDAITIEIQTLPEELCQRDCRSVPERLQLCKDLEGKHIEQYL